jgi:acetylornithine deacetylase/succinyl-diaminopimelate desuccinylase-like protein
MHCPVLRFYNARTLIQERKTMSNDSQHKAAPSKSQPTEGTNPFDRRSFLVGAAAGAATLALPRWMSAGESGFFAGGAPVAFDEDLSPIRAEITKRHDETVKRMQTWIRQPSIAAENRGMNEGCELTMQMLREAGFQQVTKVPTDGQPGIFATLDAGAPKTLGLYFMYDVKQVDPSEWSSPPWDAALVDKPGFGKVVVGRGAVNQKGPESAFIAALHAIRGAGRKLPVNFVFVAEGEEEIGSPHFAQVVRRPEVLAALKKTMGIFMPFASQDPDGQVTAFLGAKGVVELELVSSGEKWGRGPKADIHSSNKARLDSPAWHLIKALNTLVSADGNDPAITGFADKARPISAQDKAMIATAARRMDEKSVMKQMGVEHWVHDVSFQESLELLVSRPTVNIEGLVGGYTGPGGKTVLPHRAVAKIDMRLVPDMTAADALAALKAHLAKNGFGDIEVNMTGGYDPTTTPADAALVRAEHAVYKRAGIDPIVMPRLAGSWPGYVFTGAPLNLPAGHFGLGHGSGAHAPNEYYVIESSNPKVQGVDGSVMSYVEYLYEVARTA